MFREYKKLDENIFKNVYAANKDVSLADRSIYIFGDQEYIVVSALLLGKDYTIDKVEKVVGNTHTSEKIYVVVLNTLGYKRLDGMSASLKYKKGFTSLDMFFSDRKFVGR